MEQQGQYALVIKGMMAFVFAQGVYIRNLRNRLSLPADSPAIYADC